VFSNAKTQRLLEGRGVTRNAASGEGFSGLAAARLEDDQDARGGGVKCELEESSQAT
jgi:hypothetical protein